MIFVDDIVIFRETSLFNIQYMLKVIEDFWQGSSQQINVAKSQSIRPENLSHEIKLYLFQEKSF